MESLLMTSIHQFFRLLFPANKDVTKQLEPRGIQTFWPFNWDIDLNMFEGIREYGWISRTAKCFSGLLRGGLCQSSWLLTHIARFVLLYSEMWAVHYIYVLCSRLYRLRSLSLLYSCFWTLLKSLLQPKVSEERIIN